MRWRVSAVHSSDSPGGRLEVAAVQQLESADDALAVGRLDRLGGPRGPAGQHRVQRRGAARLELGDPPLAHALGGDGAQAQLGERGTEVEAGAADDDRAAAGGQQAVDLGMGQLGVLARAERGVDGQEGQQPVLELGALARRRPRR